MDAAQSDELAALLAKIAKAEARVDKAQTALDRAEERDPAGTGSEVSRKEQILIGALTTHNLLLEEKKRLTAMAGTAAGEGERLSVICYLIPFILLLFP